MSYLRLPYLCTSRDIPDTTLEMVTLFMLKYLSVDEYCEWVTTYRDEDMALSPVCCVCWNTCEVCIPRNVGLRIFHE